MVVVDGANIQDRDGATLVLAKMKKRFVRPQLIRADGGYSGRIVEWVKTTICCVLQIVKRSDQVLGLEVLPVERTLGWLNKYRRLSKDYEQLAKSSESMIHLAVINVMLHRVAPT